jgi:BNR repeat-like domain
MRVLALAQNPRTPGRARLAAAALAVVALALGVAAVGRAVSLPDGELAAGRNVRVNPVGPLEAHNSPSLAANPRRPDNVVLTHRLDRTEFSSFVEWSDDGGRSWRQTALPLPAGIDRPFAPDAAFAPDGTLYVSYVNLVGNGNVPDNLWVARSTDGGRSLSAPVRVAGELAFQGRIAAGTDGSVYVTWLQAREVGLFKMPRTPNPIVAARSTDGARTFSGPVVVSDLPRQRVAAASPVVDRDGRLVVLYEDFKSDRRDFEFLEGPPAEEPFALVLTVSTDGGRTFSPGRELETGVVATRRFLVFLPEFPSLAAGRDGSLVVAWADGRSGDEDVLLRRSVDGGRTWTDAVKVNDNRLGDGTDQYLPRVAVAPSGRIDVLFLDRRRDRKNVFADAFLAVSENGGRSFENLRVSSKSFDTRVGPMIDATFPVDFGSRLGLVSRDDGILAAWTDSRFGNEGTGRQDIFAARVTSESAGALDWAGVVVLGLLAVGAAAAAVVLASKGSRPRDRRTGDDAGAGAEAAGTRAGG